MHLQGNQSTQQIKIVKEEDEIGKVQLNRLSLKATNQKQLKSRHRRRRTKMMICLVIVMDYRVGFSDDEASKPKSPIKSKKKPAVANSTASSFDDDLFPDEKATSALDNLLNGSSTTSDKKTKKPTMLEQMMSGKKVVKEKEADDVLFGGYAPTVGAGERPTTAPDKRSVRFADDLGLDLNDEKESRPKTAPSRKTSDLFDSSLDESFSKDFFGGVRKKNTDKNKETQQSTPKEKVTALTKKKALKKQSSADDWLGLGDDHTSDMLNDNLLGGNHDDDDIFPTHSKTSPRRPQPQKTKSKGKQAVGGEDKMKNADQTPTRSKPKDEFALPWDSPTEKHSPRQKTTKDATTKQQKEPATDSLTQETNKNEEDDFFSLIKNKQHQRRTQQNKKAEQNLENQNQPKVSTLRKQLTIDDTLNSNPNTSQSQQNIPTKSASSQLSSQTLNPDAPLSQHTTQQSLPVHSSTPFQPKKPFQQSTPQQNPAISQQVSEQQQQQLLQQEEQRMAIAQQMLFQQQQQQLLLNRQNHQQFVLPLTQQSNPAYDAETLKSLQSNIEKDLNEKYQEEFNSTKRDFEREKSYMESELRELKAKMMKLGESRSHENVNFDGKIRELENRASKLEVEKDQLLLSVESQRERHKEEIAALESSHKNRLGYIEESYKRREQQLRDEHALMTSHQQDKERAMRSEKEDLITSHKRKCELMTHNHASELDRMRQLHKKTTEDMMLEHAEQLNHLRLIKEQEVRTASTAFSQTKSLQQLMLDVQNSTKELSTLQNKIDVSHSSNLSDRELSLRSRDEYLRHLEAKLHSQETSNEDERQRLQSLVSKMEIQLREQTRQLEQDKWKLVQDENRIKAMQTALDEERRMVQQQLANERHHMASSREEMLAEQRRIIAECYEEKRKLTEERNELSAMQRGMYTDGNRSNRSMARPDLGFENMMSRYHHETSSLNIRLTEVQKQEEELTAQKEEYLHQKKLLQKEYDDIKKASLQIQKRSEEVEEFAREASRIHQEGEKALEDAHIARTEYADSNHAVEAKSFSLEQQERFINEEKSRIKKEREQLDLEKSLNVCSLCRKPKNEIYNQNGLVSQHYQSTPIQQLPYNSMNNQTLQHFPPQMNPHQPTIPYHQNNNPPSSSLQPSYLQTPQSLITHQLKQPPSLDTTYIPQPKASNLDMTYVLLNERTLDQQSKDNVYIPPTTYAELDFSIDSLAVNGGVKSQYGNRTSDILTTAIESVKGTSTPLMADENPPPDLISNNVEFNRTMRKWVSSKEKDDDFFEEEKRYLKSLQAKRTK
ncbi:fas-binding factor 1 homolog [Clytia hemisphaerica]|uniref:fas-binding factor 1 homolog n=1 Tax=Clytia hemisphaerica TaxID=252671 RepID=UPI0034D40F62